MSDKKRGPGRPRIHAEQIRVTFRLRRGRSKAENELMDRLDELPKGKRSQFIRRVLTTGDIEPVIAREFARETEAVASGFQNLANMWSVDDDE